MVLKKYIRNLLPRRHRPHSILGGPLRGMRIVTSWHDYPAAIFGYTESKLIRWLLEHVRPGETWIDVGANCGYTSIAMCEGVGPGGRVFAFEPSLSAVACLERTRRENRFEHLIPMPLALSASVQATVVRCATDRGMVDSQLTLEGPVEASQIVAIGLDAIWEGIAGADQAIHGIKMDVQGMELEALQGMERTLARHRPKIVLEIHKDVPRGEVLSVLARCGYGTDPTPIDEDDPVDFFSPQSNASFFFLPLGVPA